MDTLFYLRLAANATLTILIGSRLYPVFPTPDSGLPYVFYHRTSTEDIVNLNGPSGVKRYEYTVDIWAINADTCRAIADAVYDGLKSWRVGTIQGCFLTSDTQEETGVGYHCLQSYAVFA